MPPLALRVLLGDEADLQGQLPDKLFIVRVEEDVEEVLDDSAGVLRASDDEEQVEGHDANE